MLSMPTEHSFKQFHAWTQQYGPIFRLIAGKDTIIVLGDHATAHELLNKRSANYSDRPRLPMASELLYKGDHMLIRRFDDKYRAHRRNMGQLFTRSASRVVTPLVDMESIASLRQLLSFVEGSREARRAARAYVRHVHDQRPLFDAYCAVVMALHRFTASMSYTLLYGFRIETGEEREMKDGHLIEDSFARSMRPGVWPCDVLPALNYLPSWLAPWKRTAEGWYQFERAHHMRSNARGRASRAWNWTKALAGTRAARGLNPESLAYDAGVLNNAALDTTTQTLEMFVMAALGHPAEMRAAQAELDRVVGRGRLPSHGDERDLPYVRAVVEETLRWRPIIIAGVAHASMREDVYDGYRIPAGAVVIPNNWSIHMDEGVYEDPHAFRPERWLDDPGLPAPVGFGFGRRMCMGEYIARGSLFVMVSRLLWAFDFRRQLDEAGREIAVDSMNLADYFIVRPNPFPVDIVCRHESVRKVLDDAWEEVEKDPEAIMEEMGKYFVGKMK
ncbi:putative cytochrome p450 [Diaporthe ampelina]|uniref:Putative cytochrome p450 n=1 Tax=Diaporthe ampelina TaxID=1214573 RepID=A0A0G2FL76_9PEZI|nr:putative cytochrome p450 [Diaporthe ampelina]